MWKFPSLPRAMKFWHDHLKGKVMLEVFFYWQGIVHHSWWCYSQEGEEAICIKPLSQRQGAPTRQCPNTLSLQQFAKHDTVVLLHLHSHKIWFLSLTADKGLSLQRCCRGSSGYEDCMQEDVCGGSQKSLEQLHKCWHGSRCHCWRQIFWRYVR